MFEEEITVGRQVRNLAGRCRAGWPLPDRRGSLADNERTSEDEFDRLYRVNVKGVYLRSQAAVPVMVRLDGGVLNQ